MKKTVYICDYCREEIENTSGHTKIHPADKLLQPIEQAYGCEVHPYCKHKFQILAEKIIGHYKGRGLSQKETQKALVNTTLKNDPKLKEDLKRIDKECQEMKERAEREGWSLERVIAETKKDLKPIKI
jgi:hypothetical protein